MIILKLMSIVLFLVYTGLVLCRFGRDRLPFVEGRSSLCCNPFEKSWAKEKRDFINNHLLFGSLCRFCRDSLPFVEGRASRSTVSHWDWIPMHDTMPTTVGFKTKGFFAFKTKTLFVFSAQNKGIFCRQNKGIIRIFLKKKWISLQIFWNWIPMPD